MPATATPPTTTYTIKQLQDVDQQFNNAQTHANMLADERREIMLGLLAQGKRQSELAEAINVNPSRVWAIARRARGEAPDAS